VSVTISKTCQRCGEPLREHHDSIERSYQVFAEHTEEDCSREVIVRVAVELKRIADVLEWWQDWERERSL
jgi:hypothetical protein